MKRLTFELRKQIESDLGLNIPFVKGRDNPVKNCWHFSTDGNAVDEIFYCELDFIDGMNRIWIVSRKFDIIILAFSLMDTHVHFILYGTLEECRRFMHEYMRRTSQYIAHQHGDKNKLDGVPINYQEIDTDFYLKTAICYTLRNAPVGGLPYTAWNYPWSSGPLYFCQKNTWCSPSWLQCPESPTAGKGLHRQRKTFKTRTPADEAVPMVGKIVFPGAYVAYVIVEQLFKSCKSFQFFMGFTKESDVESRGGAISHLSIPMQEMRQHKTEVCKELFGVERVTTLSTAQRIRLARTLRARYNSSIKQIVRLCGLVYSEVSGMI
ncbi:MAG: hypothetical protein IJS91_05000 [Bacteroidales bacterium]|nr:hypothetical protein [Bacteroidales bacterium]